jgi:2-polyprenyl-6-hydroxyphenyl methylase/3-demethylubiquinone-9 3-methyltransferase
VTHETAERSEVGPEAVSGRLAGLTVAPNAPRGPLAAMRAGFRGQVPPRYATDSWRRRFDAEVAVRLVAGMDVLDVGAGARPVLARDQRPPGCTYVGLDIDAQELDKAAAGSYDRRVVADATELRPELVDGFDLVVSWMVLEHVDSLPAALASLRAYLRPDGHLVAQMPGALSLAAIGNRLLPMAAARHILARTQGRRPATIFPARYDRCRFTALERLLDGRWASWRVLPLYTGAAYTAFSPPLRASYLAYEELAYRHRWHDLAPYYLVTATAPGARPP